MNLNGKLPISLVVITKNEELNLVRCLEAANFCSEFIVVDSGSTDGTLEIASSHGARIFHRHWNGYAMQKNFGCEQAQHPWILCIDADEIVSAELRRSIATAFQTEPEVDGFELNRHALYGGTLINHSGWYPQWRLFLYRKNRATWGGLEPHAIVQFHGMRKARLDGDLYHYTYTDIRQHIAKNVSSARAAALAMHAEGRRASVISLIFRPPWAMFRTYFLQGGFLDGFWGFMIAVVAGFYTFLKYAMLRELQIRAGSSSESGTHA